MASIKKIAFLGLLLCSLLGLSSGSSAQETSLTHGADIASTTVKKAAESNPLSPVSYKVYRSSAASVFGENAWSINATLDDYVRVEVVDSGEVRKVDSTLATSPLVYSDFAELNFTITAPVINSWRNRFATNLLGKYRVNKESWYRTRLMHRVHRGALLMSRYVDDRPVDYYAPVFFDSEKALKNLLLTKDGDYKLFFLLDIDLVPFVVYINIPIRTKAFILDESKQLQLRSFGSFTDSFVVETSDEKAKIRVDGEPYRGGAVTGQGEHTIEVYNEQGLLSDRLIFSIIPDVARVYLYNYKQTLMERFYEVEGCLRCHYQKRVGTFDFRLFYAKAEEEGELHYREYTTELSQSGLYHLYLMAYLGEEERGVSESFMVLVSAYDSPSFNMDFLAGNRFNNFITKWLQVYDEAEDEYYCFHVRDYSSAKLSAMVIENNRVIRSSGTIYYREKTYGDETLLVEDMERFAEKNIVVAYYDPYHSRAEMNFSPSLFDGTRYLNQDFVFTQKSRLETNEVFLFNDVHYYALSFNRKFSDFQVPDGEYTVVERDLFGNETAYPAIVDLTAPEVLLETESGELTPKEGRTYHCNYFSIRSFLDAHDEYAVLKVNDDYYIQEEWTKALYFAEGIYYVKAYDRCGNTFAFNVVIDPHPAIHAQCQDGVASFTLDNGVKVLEWKVDGVEAEPGATLTLSDSVTTVSVFYEYENQKYAYFAEFSTQKEEIERAKYPDSNAVKRVERYPYRFIIIVIAAVVAIGFLLLGAGYALAGGKEKNDD